MDARIAAWALCALLGALQTAEARFQTEPLLQAEAATPFRALIGTGTVARVNVLTATSAASGQAGYVHFFELTAPDGSVETQVGIELAEQRIAWSFPGLGALVSPFIAQGSMTAHGTTYAVRHSYAIRPFDDEARMRALREALPSRVAILVDDGTPYCNGPVVPDRFCMSCLSFALNVLFPGPFPAAPVLPREFMRSAANPYYTTEDLLLYLSGLDPLPTREERQRRLNEMNLPAALRADLLELVAAIDPQERVGARVAASEPRIPIVSPGLRAKARTSPPRPSAKRKL